MKIQPVRGTHDLYGSELDKFNYIEKLVRDISSAFGFDEITTPIFESSNLFKKPLGEQSDVVLKEMYTFLDKNDSFLTLRPEYTTPIIRAAISNNLINRLPTKLFGFGPMFRRERPQKGRFRQFYQMNFEILGSDDILADVELILIAQTILKNLLPGENINLHLNSLGDKDTLKKFKSELSLYYKKFQNDLSLESQKRIQDNPIRILDSKESKDLKINNGAPKIENLYSKNANQRFENVQNLLSKAGISFSINQNLVRGLDYYCHTVFEFKSTNLGSQDTIIGGGKYDGLVKLIGGPNIPGIGWAGGIERIMLLKKSVDKKNIENHLIVTKEIFKDLGFKTLKLFYENKIPLYWDYKYNLKKSLSFANEKKAKFVIIIGDEEYNKNVYTLKNLTNSNQHKLSIEELIKTLIK